MRRSRILCLLALTSLFLLGSACDSGTADESANQATAEQQEGQEQAEEGEEYEADEQGEEQEQHEPGEHMGEQHEPGEHMGEQHEPGEHMGSGMHGHVEVSAEGTRFDPPVQPEQIPNGAWYCNMGTVHYAAMERGDGSCPICGMNLAQKGADEQAPE